MRIPDFPVRLFQSDITGTFQTVTNGTFLSATTGTFQSDTGGTFIPLLSMSVIDYFKTLHRIPSLDEQKEIAKRLNAIDYKLQVEHECLGLLKRQKDGLLKQMFI